MSDSIPPSRGLDSGRRVSQRRAGDRPPEDGRSPPRRDTTQSQPEQTSARLPALASPNADSARSRLQSFAAFAAQLLGQGGQKRGLRGGPETLERARSTYLETEWSGPSDRRVHTGRITKTDI